MVDRFDVHPLILPGVREDDEADSVAWDGIDTGAVSAEEAAIHLVEDPDGPGDGPLR
ncbi:DUF5709 domain-containing protein [Micromonospora sp. NPDC005254]|uniref:DUF5709 domain-containing protein n=1 Tax=Micromonospora sp. NPDC005254 TaxID=3364229 RepID=UPI0036BF5A00